MDDKPKMVTAGVYVLVERLFVFQVGPTRSGETLGVVRLGGHREGNETGWERAAREAFEEASLRVTPLKPPATYWESSDGKLEKTPPTWSMPFPDEILPFLITRRKVGTLKTITPIYLGYSCDVPQPNAEAKVLLLLRPTDIQRLTTEAVTLKDYLEQGGKTLFRETLSSHLVLGPFSHLRWLHLLLQRHPEIMYIIPDN